MSPAPEPSTPAKPAPNKAMPVAWWLVPLVVLGLAGVAYLVVLARYSVDGPAMEPGMPPGTTFFIVRQVWASAPEPGAIIVCRTFDGIEVVKRIVAVGGQRVEIRQDQLIIDGRVVSELVECPRDVLVDGTDETVCRRERLGAHEWLTVASTFSVPEDMPTFLVPADHVFVVGDHRDRSNDSRNPRISAIPRHAIVGTVVGY